MRIASSTPEDEIFAALVRDAADSWGEQRLPALEPQLRRFAHAIWLVLQVELDPMDEPPDYLGPALP